MKNIITFCSLFCFLANICLAQQNKLQPSINISPLDAHAAAEFSLSGNSTLYTAIGFGYGSVNTIHLNKYYIESEQNGGNSDIVMPEIFFAPYLNIQYRNYFLRARESREGYYTGSNSGMYAGARLKLYTAPVIAMHDEGQPIKESYMFGLIIGWQKAVGGQRSFIFNANTGVSTHSNYNLSFFGFKPMLYGSVGYIIR